MKRSNEKIKFINNLHHKNKSTFDEGKYNYSLTVLKLTIPNYLKLHNDYSTFHNI